MSSKQQLILTLLAALVLVLLGTLLGVSRQDGPQFIANQPESSAAPRLERLTQRPAVGQFWLGLQVPGKVAGSRQPLVPVAGQSPDNGRYLLYVDPGYAAALAGGLGPARPIPLSVSTYPGDIEFQFSEAYGVSKTERSGAAEITYSSSGLMAWFTDSGQTVVISAWSNPTLLRALERLGPA